MKRVLVLGSLNIDLVQRVGRMPALGETLKGDDLQIFVGGKGANQACAAALLGAAVRMAGRVGNDVFAERLVAELRQAGVNTELVIPSQRASGSATILVLPAGENMIVISSGANADLSPDFASKAVESLAPGDLLLCQLETPLESVQAALHSAHRRKVMTILDPAPACPLPTSILSSVSILTPNQTEAAILAGVSEAPETLAEAEVAARYLQSLGAPIVIVKMGDQGCLIADGTGIIAKPGYRVKVSDTTAAGDTFNGALAAALTRDATLGEAAEFANAAGALSVMKPGAISSIPTRSEVEQFLRSH